jgi:hypothetical protein
MFEALGHVEDRELMLVNLDLIDTPSAAQFPAKQLHFVLYNPTLEQRSASFSIPAAQGAKVRLTVDDKPIDSPLKIPAHGIARLTAEF